MHHWWLQKQNTDRMKIISPIKSEMRFQDFWTLKDCRDLFYLSMKALLKISWQSWRMCLPKMSPSSMIASFKVPMMIQSFSVKDWISRWEKSFPDISLTEITKTTLLDWPTTSRKTSSVSIITCLYLYFFSWLHRYHQENRTGTTGRFHPLCC